MTGQPDPLVPKQVNSCFHSTPDLDGWIRGQDLDAIVLSGITTNHCCETTARVGGNLRHQVVFALDATHASNRTSPDGRVISADDLAHVTATKPARRARDGGGDPAAATGALMIATSIGARLVPGDPSARRGRSLRCCRRWTGR